jgi:hypothetical protein
MTQAEHIEWTNEDYDINTIPKLTILPPALGKAPWNPSELTSAQKFDFRDMTDCYMSPLSSLVCSSGFVDGVQYNEPESDCDYHEYTGDSDSEKDCFFPKSAQSNSLNILPPWVLFFSLQIVHPA